ncbi:MAG: HAMP domain-containing histidine kinase [Candidatus Nealsonbacteria bacterium]|nr:HAMP domain-containing histidine kinase [Candidatus Nealsonbacteria bacterium]
MGKERTTSQFNVIQNCRNYDIPLWQCPQFLFIIMGLVMIGAIMLSSFIGTKYLMGPEIIVLATISITIFLFIIAFIIVQSFEKMAEANRMKTEFINIASHQLRTPLTNIKWGSDAIINENLNKDQADSLKIIQINIERMAKLISGLLMVSRIEQKRLTRNDELFSLEEMARQIIAESKFHSDGRKINVNFVANDNLPKIMGDPFQIKTVFENLLNNALKHSPENTTINVSLARKGKSALLEISDNGIGIPEEDHKYIFQKFFKAKNVMKTNTEGTGLGLFICKSIIKSMGGDINFKSAVGKGTTFWFTLPLINKK